MTTETEKAPLSGEHKARHGCSGRPTGDVISAGNGFRATCDTCEHPHHLSAAEVKP